MAEESERIVFKKSDNSRDNWERVAKSKYVFITKDDDKIYLLAKWGLVASGWSVEHVGVFEGKEKVVVLSEGGDTGRDYTLRITSALHGKVGELKVVETPELEEREELIRLAKNTPVWTPPLTPVSEPELSPKTKECDEATIEETINSMSKKTQNDEIRKILTRIALSTYSFEQSKYIRCLSEKTGISMRALRDDVESITKKQSQETVDSDITIAHPGYEVNRDFMGLGFRETVISGDHTEDRNLFLVSEDGKFELLHDKMTEREFGVLLFDVRGRVLVNINEKWSKSRMLEFIKNPTSPVGLYQEIKQTLKQYVELGSDGHCGLLTSWIMATYFHRCFNAIPFVFLYGKKGCGKTRGLDLLERLAFNAYKTKGISVASLGDSIDATRSTFLNDQAESLSDPKNVEILGILTDSYTSGGGKRRVVVISNKNRKVVEFETYSPKAFASIKEIDSDLKDRCILFPMIRASKEYPYPEAHLPVWGELRDKLYRLLLVKWKDAKEIYQTTGEGVTHRVKELNGY